MSMPDPITIALFAATGAGIVDHVWTLEEINVLLNKQETGSCLTPEEDQ